MASRNLVLKVAEDLLTPENLPDLKEYVQGKLLKAAGASDIPSITRLSLLSVAIDAATSTPDATVHKGTDAKPGASGSTATTKPK